MGILSHGKSQWISTVGTSWACANLTTLTPAGSQRSSSWVSLCCRYHMSPRFVHNACSTYSSYRRCRDLFRDK
jgi:hypothetical protein